MRLSVRLHGKQSSPLKFILASFYASLACYSVLFHISFARAQQKPPPTDVAGVEVIIGVLDPNNNCYEVGRTTSDASGFFKLSFVPEVPSEYTVITTFASSQGYCPSHAETALFVEEAPAATPEPTPTPAPMTDTYVRIRNSIDDHNRDHRAVNHLDVTQTVKTSKNTQASFPLFFFGVKVTGKNRAEWALEGKRNSSVASLGCIFFSLKITNQSPSKPYTINEAIKRYCFSLLLFEHPFSGNKVLKVITAAD